MEESRRKKTNCLGDKSLIQKVRAVWQNYMASWQPRPMCSSTLPEKSLNGVPVSMRPFESSFNNHFEWQQRRQSTTRKIVGLPRPLW